MSGNADVPNEPEATTAAVYRGPLEEFIARRDALVKHLRASGQREDAAQVKAWRKPSRPAWALNTIVYNDPDAVEQLVAAIAAAQSAPADGPAAMRAALENIRNAVRAVAQAGMRTTMRAGHPLDAAALVPAVQAVIGDAAAFAELRAGRLVDVPEGGGLDILTALSAAGSSAPAVAAPPAPSATETADRATTARADLLRAESALKRAREQAKDTERALLIAQAKLDAAEQQLQRAREETDARRVELERAQQSADAAAGQIEAAERAVEAARAAVPG